MDKQVYSLLNLEYEKKRSQAIFEAEHKKNALYSKYPLLQEIDEQIKLQSISSLKSFLHNSLKAEAMQKELSVKLLELKEKRQALLVAYNIPPEAFSPIYECLECSDTGYLDSGKICSCYKQKLLNLAYRQNNINLTSFENFETFDANLFPDKADKNTYNMEISPRENILKVKNYCLRFIDQFDSPDTKNLMFVGETGRGKTFLSNCIAKELIDKNKTVIYQTAPRLFDLIISYKMRFERPENFDEQAYGELFKVDLLIIDDLGAEAQSSAKLSEFFDIINTRILNLPIRNTKTILSTNLPLEKFREHYDQRIVSRVLGEFDVIQLFGNDIRLQKKR
ncbi:MAG: ATP-binding protein [Ignavibacteriales bacterium]